MSLLTSILLYTSFVIGIFFACAYLYFTRKFGHWKKKGVPYIRPIPFAGNFKDVVLMKKCVGVLSKEMYDEHKTKPFVGIYAFDEPFLLINDLEIAKSVLIKDFQHFVDRNFQTSEKADSIGARGIIFLKGDKWKHARTSITPSFTSGKMKKMNELMMECGADLVKCLDEEGSEGQEVEVYEISARYTTDNIASCAFGIKANNLLDKHSQFRKQLRRTFELSIWETIKVVAAFFSPDIIRRLEVRIFKKEVEKFVRDTIMSTMDYRKKNNIIRNDLLASLIELKNKGHIEDEDSPSATEKTKLYVGDEDIVAHSFVFVNAGFETSATTMAYALYELALQTDVQEKLRREINDAVPSESDFTYENVHSIKYLDMVLSEVLRKYPPLPFLDRKSNTAYKVPGTQLILEKGSRIMIPVFGIQRDEQYFPNTNHFDPERFSDENKNKMNKNAYMPFGIGPRNCLGMRFAMMQTKTGLVYILKNFTIQPSIRTPKEIVYNPQTFLLQPKINIPLIFNKI